MLSFHILSVISEFLIVSNWKENRSQAEPTESTLNGPSVKVSFVVGVCSPRTFECCDNIGKQKYKSSASKGNLRYSL